LTTLLRKNITVTKSQEVKTGCNLAESFTEGYGSKRAVLQMTNIWTSGIGKQFSDAYESIYSLIHGHSEINNRVESNSSATTMQGAQIKNSDLQEKIC
jgi:hypothetical protein